MSWQSGATSTKSSGEIRQVSLQSALGASSSSKEGPRSFAIINPKQAAQLTATTTAVASNNEQQVSHLKVGRLSLCKKHPMKQARVATLASLKVVRPSTINRMSLFDQSSKPTTFSLQQKLSEGVRGNNPNLFARTADGRWSKSVLPPPPPKRKISLSALRSLAHKTTTPSENRFRKESTELQDTTSAAATASANYQREQQLGQQQQFDEEQEQSFSQEQSSNEVQEDNQRDQLEPEYLQEELNHGGVVSAANLLPSSFVVAVNNLPKKYLEDDVRGLLAAEKTHIVEITIEEGEDYDCLIYLANEESQIRVIKNLHRRRVDGHILTANPAEVNIEEMEVPRDHLHNETNEHHQQFNNHQEDLRRQAATNQPSKQSQQQSSNRNNDKPAAAAQQKSLVSESIKVNPSDSSLKQLNARQQSTSTTTATANTQQSNKSQLLQETRVFERERVVSSSSAAVVASNQKSEQANRSAQQQQSTTNSREQIASRKPDQSSYQSDRKAVASAVASAETSRRSRSQTRSPSEPTRRHRRNSIEETHTRGSNNNYNSSNNTRERERDRERTRGVSSSQNYHEQQSRYTRRDPSDSPPPPRYRTSRGGNDYNQQQVSRNQRDGDSSPVQRRSYQDDNRSVAWRQRNSDDSQEQRRANDDRRYRQ